MNNPTDETCTCPVHMAATRHGDMPALLGEASLSWAELDRQVAAVAGTLCAYGVAPRHRVAISAQPSLKYCVALWALFRLGAVACPLNPALPRARAGETLRLLRPALLLTDQEHAYPSLNSADLPAPGTASGHILPDTNAVQLSLDAPCTVILTSGSSGTPRAAVHSLRNHVSAARAANANLPLAPGDRWLLSLPLYHVSGMAILFRCAMARAAVVVPPEKMPLEDALEKFDATHASLVPTQLRRLLAAPAGDERLRRMKGVLLGGAPLDSALAARAVDAGVPLVCSYGMTETAAQICATRPGADTEELQSSGRPLAPDTVRIAADGTIEVGGTTLFLGYYEEDGGVRRPETTEGWFRTGDTGYFDAHGLLHVSGRADAMFISGGENIHPEEIEAALCALPGIIRAVVVPAPDMEYDAVPAAFVELSTGTSLATGQWRADLRRSLPGYKIPRYFFHWPETCPAQVKPDRPAFAREARNMLEKNAVP